MSRATGLSAAGVWDIWQSMRSLKPMIPGSRVRNNDITSFDIHDRVNYSVKKSTLKINEDKSIIKLKLSIDTKYGSIMDYFEIFLGRMVMCRKAAEKLGLQFKLIINEQQLI